jgi:GT2 family glycosyltransferase
MTEPHVAVVVATFNRADVLDRTLAAVAAQSRAPDDVIVVDNGSSDETVAMVRGRHPDVTCIELGDNRGAGAGLAAGMRSGLDRGTDVFWLLDDDTQPSPSALQTLLDVLAATTDLPVGIIATSGGMIRRGVITHLPARELPMLEPSVPGYAGLRTADFVVYDGGLVARRAVDRAGLPREDFFLIFDDLEYAMRVHEAGLELVVIEEDINVRMHLGSGGGSEPVSPPWRGYYQTRNHLRSALDRRSPLLVWGWAVRNAKFVVGTLIHGDRKVERLRLRGLAVLHALTGRLGRRVEP